VISYRGSRFGCEILAFAGNMPATTAALPISVPSSGSCRIRGSVLMADPRGKEQLTEPRSFTPLSVSSAACPPWRVIRGPLLWQLGVRSCPVWLIESNPRKILAIRGSYFYRISRMLRINFVPIL
jgi:hypothetical protein